MAEPTAFRDETRELLTSRPASLDIKTIANDIEVSTGWLNQFARGLIENPGVVTIFKLNAYLKEAAAKKTTKKAVK